MTDIYQAAENFLEDYVGGKFKKELAKAQSTWAAVGGEFKYFVFCSWDGGWSCHFTDGETMLADFRAKCAAESDEGWDEVWIDADGNEYKVVPTAVKLERV